MMGIMCKVSWKDISMGFQLTVFENKHTFMKKKLFCTQRFSCTAKLVKFYVIYFRGGSRTAASSKIEHFVIIVNG